MEPSLLSPRVGPRPAVAALVAAVLLMLGAPVAGAREARHRQWWKNLKTRAKDRAIIEQSTAGRYWTHEGSGFWTPTLAEVTELEQKLPDYLLQRLGDQPYNPWGTGSAAIPLWKKAPLYKRQYVGVTKEGVHVIHVIFFCALDFGRPYNWHVYPLVVFDGGDCFFRIDYDPKSGLFSDLGVNGEA